MKKWLQVNFRIGPWELHFIHNIVFTKLTSSIRVKTVFWAFIEECVYTIILSALPTPPKDTTRTKNDPF